MSTEYWNIHNDFEKTPSRELVNRFWIDDELNRQRSETTFKDQAVLVDEGLKFFMEALQGPEARYLHSLPPFLGPQALGASAAIVTGAATTGKGRRLCRWAQFPYNNQPWSFRQG